MTTHDPVPSPAAVPAPLPVFDDNALAIALRQYAQPGETTPTEIFRRVADWVAAPDRVEALRQPGGTHGTDWAGAYYDLMRAKKFCPGGRVLAGAGTAHGNVLNCFVQEATEHEPHGLAGVLELARKLALVTKVGGGNGVNIDAFAARVPALPSFRRGAAYLDATHPDALDFASGLMRPPTQPDGDKVAQTLKNWDRVLVLKTRGVTLPGELLQAAAAGGVRLLIDPGLGELVRNALPAGLTVEYGHAPERTVVPDDLGGIIDAAGEVVNAARCGAPLCIDLSGMRPEGALIRGSGGTSSGPVSFLVEIFDNFLEWANLGAETSGPVATLRYVCASVLRVTRQGGTRRGAGMGTILIDNPASLDFLTSKDLDRELGEGDISTFNISFLIPDAFMATLQQGGWVTVRDPVTGQLALLDPPSGKYVLRELVASGHVRELRGADRRAYHEVRAQFLWDEIALHAWQTGEPGLLFEGRINEHSAIGKLGSKYQIRSTNPCGEVPLTPGESCDLGAFNLAAYVVPDGNDPFNPALGHGPYFAEEDFRRDVWTAVRFLDNVLDVNVFALEDNREAGQDLRRLGLGVMGMADALILLGLRYDSQEGRDKMYEVMSLLRREAVLASEGLALSRGNYPLYDRVNDGVGERLISHAPRRNVALVTVAPTGTTSMLMGVSSGIEPVYSPFIYRKIGASYVTLLSPLLMNWLDEYIYFLPEEFTTLQDDPAEPGMLLRSLNEAAIAGALGGNHGSLQGLDWIPEEIRRVFLCAHDVSPLDHVRMQGAVQRAFDDGGELAANSLSKTVNMPNQATAGEIQAAYLEAYTSGCKGVTVYRDGSRAFQVLSVSSDEAEKAEPGAALPGAASYVDGQMLVVKGGALVPFMLDVTPFEYQRPARLEGYTDRVQLMEPGAARKRTFLVNVGHDGLSPWEIVLTAGKSGEEANADAEALGRLASVALQGGVPRERIVETLRGINGGLYGSYQNRMVGSKADLIAVALDAYSPSLRALVGGEEVGDQVFTDGALITLVPLDAPAEAAAMSVAGGQLCPSCGQLSVVREEGCNRCLAPECGFSKCG